MGIRLYSVLIRVVSSGCKKDMGLGLADHNTVASCKIEAVHGSDVLWSLCLICPQSASCAFGTTLSASVFLCMRYYTTGHFIDIAPAIQRGSAQANIPPCGCAVPYEIKVVLLVLIAK